MARLLQNPAVRASVQAELNRAGGAVESPGVIDLG